MPLLELRGPFAASGEAVAEDRGGEGDGANAMTVEELLRSHERRAEEIF